MAKPRHVVVGKGNLCPDCSLETERRKHKEIREKQKRAPFYFSEWDACKKCRKVWFYEIFKVWNHNEAAQNYLKHQQELRELRTQHSHLKSI